MRKMTDTRWLAMPPAAGERTVQFSSYDRASRLENGTMVHPFANGDSGHYLRVEGEGGHREWVLAEAQGPGYVSRIWSANPAGELRIYIDGAAAPALAAPFAAITSGEIAPFVAPFGHDASRGRNLYFPFPFAKSIKITTTKGDQYFQVSVTTLPQDTKVESYSSEVLKRAASVLAETRHLLLNPQRHLPNGPGHTDFAILVAAGGSVQLEPIVAPSGRTRSHQISGMSGRCRRPRRRPGSHALDDHFRRRPAAPGRGSARRVFWLGSRCEPVRVRDPRGAQQRLDGGELVHALPQIGSRSA